MIFPSDRAVQYIEILHGRFGFFKGQTIHEILRDSTVIQKQIFYGICKVLLNNVTIHQINEEWKRHTKTFPFRGHKISFGEYVTVWFRAIKQVILESILQFVREIVQMVDDNRYAMFIDWLCTVGVVPFERKKDTDGDRSRVNTIFRNNASRLVYEITKNKMAFLQQVITRLDTVSIPEFAQVSMYKRRRDGRIESLRLTDTLNTYVYSEPIALNHRLLFTTPLAHLYTEIIKYDGLRRHQKMCQLLNTFPIKAVTTTKSEVSSKKIMDLIEKEEKNTDAKKTLMKFLLNLSDSKSKIGIQDSVESFLQDITPSVIDQSKLLPAHGIVPKKGSDSDIREAFKKQVIKCMEEQIQTQMSEIETLKLANKTFESKIKELRSVIDRYGQSPQHDITLDQDLDSVSLATALNKVQSIPFHTVDIDDGRAVANSFLSQFIPNTDHSQKQLDNLWELEYMRSFKLRKNVNNQGQEESISFSNSTVELIVLPFVFKVLGLPNMDAIPEEFLSLSFGEIITTLYENSRTKHYLRLLYNRELSRELSTYPLPDSTFGPIDTRQFLTTSPDDEPLTRKLQQSRQARNPSRRGDDSYRLGGL